MSKLAERDDCSQIATDGRRREATCQGRRRARRRGL